MSDTVTYVKVAVGAIRMASVVTDDLTDDEMAWLQVLRDIGGGHAPPLTLPNVQILRRICSKPAKIHRN